MSSPIKPANDEVESTSNDFCKVNSETRVETKFDTDKSEGCRSTVVEISKVT